MGKKKLQKLIFDLEMGWNNTITIQSNNLSDCLNYTEVSESIISFIDGRYFSLIECLAEEIAIHLIDQFNLPWIKIKLRKPSAIVKAKSAGIIIERWK